MQRLSVLFSAPLGCYDYLSDFPVKVGQFVLAPFGHKKCIGIVWHKEADQNFPESKMKKIESVFDKLPLFTKENMKFIDWVAGYTLAPLGSVLKMALCTDLNKESKKPLQFDIPVSQFHPIQFSEAQQIAVQELNDICCDGFAVSLLDGVTGSGKTEVYFEIVSKAIEKGKQVLVLLPEITLTASWLDRFCKRFGTYPAVWHSNITPKQRRDTWRAVASGQARVVVGARSALFLPYQKLNLIVVDEEHDASFKQEDGVLYHARDMAVVRAKIADCPIILASATPSVETYCNVSNGKYYHVVLPERFAGAVMPDILLADMRQKEKGCVRFISPKLQEELAARLLKHEQSLLFLNRRGYAPLILCRACGERLKCPHCSAWLVEHKQKKYLQCHHCGYTQAVPKKCPACEQEDTFVSCGPGVERILEEAHTLFPDAHIEMITSDTLSNPKQFIDIVERMNKNEIDILIGTQILAKGHHFKNLTLVGIIDADMGLSGGDLRAGERTFQLLQQVMGRAGREQKKGMAIIQTYAPDNMIIQALKNNNRDLFLREEINSRKTLNMPPFGKLAAFIISGKRQDIVAQAASKIVQKAPYLNGLEILGPVPAPIALLRDKYRYRILVKASKEIKLQTIIRQWMSQISIPSTVDVRIDIDPYSFF